jgi:hypothetical protein
MSKLTLLCGVLIAGVIVLSLAGCQKVTRDNYDKITADMTVADVERILGKGELQNGVAGAIGNLGGSVEVYKWVDKDNDKSITVTFVNGKMKEKHATGL